MTGLDGGVLLTAIAAFCGAAIPALVTYFIGRGQLRATRGDRLYRDRLNVYAEFSLRADQAISHFSRVWARGERLKGGEPIEVLDGYAPLLMSSSEAIGRMGAVSARLVFLASDEVERAAGDVTSAVWKLGAEDETASVLVALELLRVFHEAAKRDLSQ